MSADKQDFTFELPEIPSIAKGTVIPNGIQELWLKGAKEKRSLKEAATA